MIEKWNGRLPVPMSSSDVPRLAPRCSTPSSEPEGEDSASSMANGGCAMTIGIDRWRRIRRREFPAALDRGRDGRDAWIKKLSTGEAVGLCHCAISVLHGCDGGVRRLAALGAAAKGARPRGQTVTRKRCGLRRRQQADAHDAKRNLAGSSAPQLRTMRSDAEERSARRCDRMRHALVEVSEHRTWKTQAARPVDRVRARSSSRSPYLSRGMASGRRAGLRSRCTAMVQTRCANSSARVARVAWELAHRALGSGCCIGATPPASGSGASRGCRKRTPRVAAMGDPAAFRCGVC